MPNEFLIVKKKSNLLTRPSSKTLVLFLFLPPLSLLAVLQAKLSWFQYENLMTPGTGFTSLRSAPESQTEKIIKGEKPFQSQTVLTS